MDYNGFKELVLNRQATRGFNDKEIDKETLNKILDLSRFSPSACNSQPWKIYCVTDKKKLPLVARALQDGGTVNGFTSGAKALIVLAEKSAVLNEHSRGRLPKNHFTKYDIGELIAYITLSAKSLGVDSCIIGWVDSDMVKEVVGLEEDEECHIVIALGYSDIPLREKTRKDFKNVVKFI